MRNIEILSIAILLCLSTGCGEDAADTSAPVDETVTTDETEPPVEDEPPVEEPPVEEPFQTAEERARAAPPEGSCARVTACCVVLEQNWGEQAQTDCQAAAAAGDEAGCAAYLALNVQRSNPIVACMPAPPAPADEEAPTEE